MNNTLLIRRKAIISNNSVGLNYFKITALEDGNLDIKYVCPTPWGIFWEPDEPIDIDIEYSINGGGFTQITSSIEIKKDDIIELRRNLDSVATTLMKTGISHNTSRHFNINISSSANIIASGNIMSLLDKTCQSNIMSYYCFAYMFYNCDKLLHYNSDIIGVCDNERYVIDNSNYTSSQLSFTFYGCTGLITAPKIMITNPGSSFTSTFFNCSNITSHHLYTLPSDTSDNTFYGNTSCTEFTIYATVPPTILQNTLSGLNSDCIIYVPAESVEAYKQTQYWNDRADYIFGLDENGEIPS